MALTAQQLYDNLKEKLPRLHPAGEEEYWIAEGDLLLTKEDLYAYALRYVRDRDGQDEPKRLMAEVKDGMLIRWKSGLTLTYCVVRHTFTRSEDYEFVVSAMLEATEAWTEACGVKFEHLAELDTTPAPTLQPEGVIFTLRQETLGRFVALAFFPHQTGARRVVRVDPSLFSLKDVAEGGYDKVGVLRHELGHVLGFRHEHTRAETPPACHTDESAYGYPTRDLTKYDPQSVMHYFCSKESGIGTRTMELTELDRQAAKKLYETPDDECELYS